MYAGLVISSALPVAALADLLVSAVNNNAGAWHQSRALLAAEEEAVSSFRRRLGLPTGAVGMTLPGGTFANLQGLVLARARAFPDGPPPLEARLYTSEAAHFSIERAARIIGLGRASIVAVPTTGRGAMDVDALAARVAADRAAGARPFAVAATLGTTGTGAIDPLPAIAELCRLEHLWLHVDACYGGAALLLDDSPREARALGRADSVAVDPHKWFFMPAVTALLFHRHPEVARRAFADAASYIPGRGDEEPWQMGIATSRRAAGLTLWLALRAHGWRPIAGAVARTVALTRRLEARLAAAGLRVLPGGALSIACARAEPPGLDPRALDRLQAEIAARVAATGRAWFATTRHGGLTWLRFNLMSFRTTERHVDELVDLVASAVCPEAGAPADPDDSPAPIPSPVALARRTI
jgi:aromatic-L-amino-acid decarboxylase